MKIVIVSGSLLNIMGMSDSFLQSISLTPLFAKLTNTAQAPQYEKIAILHITEEVVYDIIQTHMATEFNLQPITIHVQQELLLFVGMELIVSVKVGEELVRIMAEWQDGIDKIHGLLQTKIFMNIIWNKNITTQA